MGAHTARSAPCLLPCSERQHWKIYMLCNFTSTYKLTCIYRAYLRDNKNWLQQCQWQTHLTSPLQSTIGRVRACVRAQNDLWTSQVRSGILSPVFPVLQLISHLHTIPCSLFSCSLFSVSSHSPFFSLFLSSSHSPVLQFSLFICSWHYPLCSPGLPALFLVLSHFLSSDPTLPS